MEKHQKKRQRRGGAGSSRASKGGSSSFPPPLPAMKKTKRKRTKTKELLEVGDTVYYCPAFATNGSDTVPLRSVIVEIQIDAEDSPALVVTDHGHRLRCIDDVQVRQRCMQCALRISSFICMLFLLDSSSLSHMHPLFPPFPPLLPPRFLSRRAASFEARRKRSDPQDGNRSRDEQENSQV
jgi:hypothetical protein